MTLLVTNTFISLMIHSKSASKKQRSCGTHFEDKKLRATLQELPYSLRWRHGDTDDHTIPDAAPLRD